MLLTLLLFASMLMSAGDVAKAQPAREGEHVCENCQLLLNAGLTQEDLIDLDEEVTPAAAAAGGSRNPAGVLAASLVSPWL